MVGRTENNGPSGLLLGRPFFCDRPSQKKRIAILLCCCLLDFKLHSSLLLCCGYVQSKKSVDLVEVNIFIKSKRTRDQKSSDFFVDYTMFEVYLVQKRSCTIEVSIKNWPRWRWKHFGRIRWKSDRFIYLNLAANFYHRFYNAMGIIRQKIRR